MSIAEVMDTEMLRETLRYQIGQIDNPVILDQLYRITSQGAISRPLTPEQREDIHISREQIRNGQWVSHEDLMKELDEEYPDDESCTLSGDGTLSTMRPYSLITAPLRK